MADTTISDLHLRNPSAAIAAPVLPPLRVGYETAPLEQLLADPTVLAIGGFGSAAPDAATDPRCVLVPLQPVSGPAPFEVWRGSGAAQSGREGPLRWSSDGDYACAMLEVDEGEHGGVAAAARHAYDLLGRWLAAAPTPHVLRIWNYLDAINAGDGDAERYREFCRGRADGMRGIFDAGFPAATAIGGRDGRRILRLFWIAARVPGAALENPRQVSAWRYPRQYGPSAPTFARAMRAPTCAPQLYISGTAAIVGHRSHHDEDFAAQVDETMANFSSLLDAAGVAPAARFGAAGLLRAYVRRPEHAARAGALLQARLPAGTPLLLLHGDICRRELLVEIDGMQTG